jgi:hypothetical protein
VQVAACRGYRGVPKRGLHQVDRRATLKRVRRVAVAQPVRQHLALNACAHCGFGDDPLDHAWIKMTAVGPRLQVAPFEVGDL